MKTLKSSALFFGLLLLPACGKQLVEFGNLGTTDSGAPDGRAIKSTSSLEISSGDLTLDGKGDGNAVFIFQMASTLTTTSGVR